MPKHSQKRVQIPNYGADEDWVEDAEVPIKGLAAYVQLVVMALGPMQPLQRVLKEVEIIQNDIARRRAELESKRRQHRARSHNHEDSAG